MPELPEVEVTRRGIAPELEDQTIAGADCRAPMLRQALDPDLPQHLAGRRIVAVHRRAKYLLLECAAAGPRGCGTAAVSHRMTLVRSPDAPYSADPSHSDHSNGSGWLIIHLGMSGSLRFVPPGTPPALHDHFDLVLVDKILRFRDPRRFGLVAWHDGTDVETDPLLRDLGPEPLTAAFDGRWLHTALAARKGPIKPTLMDAHLVVGIGNIYASESLFRAGISPLRAANRISAARCDRLAVEIRQTLSDAIAAGGSSLRDFVHTDGGAGCFQVECAVYDRAGAECRRCQAPIRQIRQAGRSTFYCAKCQT
jgi:formamidopyrimidine-DNA glycosylase